MNFKSALEIMKQGLKVKLPHWSGYWQLENGAVKMYCKDGNVLDLRETQDTLYTLTNIVSDEWEVADQENSKLLNDELVQTFAFGEALRNLRQGKQVTRKGWNGKGMYITYQKAYPQGIPINKNTAEATGILEGTVCRFLPYLMMKTVDNSFVPWLASQTDILAEDWTIVEDNRKTQD